MTVQRRVSIIITIVLLGLLGLAPPAHAAPPDQWGFGYVDNPAAPMWTLLNPAHQATSLGTKVEGGKISAGRFQVRFGGLGSGKAGIVHVTAVDPLGHYCETVEWAAVGGDELVEVQCFAPGGVPDDSKFMVLWTLNTSMPAFLPGSYASAQFAVGAGFIQSYNSTGGPIAITQLATGIYFIRFAKVGAGGGQITGNVQVTAQSRAHDPRWCKVLAWDDSGSDMVVQVGCFDAGGASVDADFTTTYHRERSVVSTNVPPKYLGYVLTMAPLPPSAFQTNFNYVAGGFGFNKAVINGTGHVVTFPKMAIDQTHAQVTAFGYDANYCTLGKQLASSGSDLIVYSRCYTPAGTPTQDNALVTATNRG